MKYPRIYLLILALVMVWYGMALVHLVRLDAQHPIDSETSYRFPVLAKDSTEYATLAEHLLQYHTFSLSTKLPFTPETFRTPGYPLFVAGVLGFFHTFIAVSILQILLTFCTGYFIYLIARNMLPDELAFTAMGLYLIEPTVTMQSFLVLSDTFFVFLFVLVIFLLFRDTTNWKTLGMAGILCGWAILVRPLAIYIPFILAGYIAFTGRKHWWRPAITHLAIFLIGVAIILIPWLVRNKGATGVWGISSVGPYNFFYSNLVPYLAVRDHTDEIGVVRGLEAQLRPIHDARSLTYSRVFTHLVVQELWRDPFGYIRYHLIKTAPLFLSSSLKEFVKLWNGNLHVSSGLPSLSDLLVHRDFRTFLGAVSTQGWYTLERVFWLLICALGVIALWEEKHREFVIVSILFILYFALLTGPVSYTRYRLPLEPFLIITATIGVFQLWRAWKHFAYA